MKIFLLFFITQITLSKITKKTHASIMEFDRTLQKMKATQAITTITQYKDLTGKSPKISVPTIRRLIAQGHKKQIRNLFLKEGIDILTEQFLTDDEEAANTIQIHSLKSILQLLGIPLGYALGTKIPKNRAVYHKARDDLKLQVNKNYVKKLNRKSTITHIDTSLNDLESRFNSISSEVENKVYTLKAVTEVHFQHDGRGMINN